jgi:hypothetical protein
VSVVLDNSTASVTSTFLDRFLGPIPEAFHRTVGAARAIENGSITEPEPPATVVIRVRALLEDDATWKEASLRQAWGGTTVARKGELVDVVPLEGFVALDGTERIGLLTYALRERCGMTLVAVHPDGVARSRAVKPSIPLVDRHGVPIGDDLEFELLLPDG